MGEQLPDRLWRVPGIRCSMAMAWKFVHDKPVSYAAWYLQQEKGPHSVWSLESGLIRRGQYLDEKKRGELFRVGQKRGKGASAIMLNIHLWALLIVSGCPEQAK